LIEVKVIRVAARNVESNGAESPSQETDMHDGCGETFSDGEQVVSKLRMMGFSPGLLPAPFELDCRDCGKSMLMTTYEFACPHCGAVHGVTPCHASSPENVRCAGVGF